MSTSNRLQELLAQVPASIGDYKGATETVDKDAKLATVMKQVEELIQEVKVTCPAPVASVAVPAPIAVADVAPQPAAKSSWLGNLFGKKVEQPVPPPQTGGQKKSKSSRKRQNGGTTPMDLAPIYNVTGLITDNTNPLALDTSAYNNVANVAPPMSTGFDRSLFAATSAMNSTIMDKIVPPISGGSKKTKKSKKSSPKSKCK